MSNRMVYVLDDEEPIRRSLSLMLRVQGYGVALFESGPTLLGVASALVPGCLLLDVRMPEMDGIEVQRRLAAENISLPAVVMTGHGDLAVAVSALQGGAVAFIEKPFSKVALNGALEVAFLKLEDPDGYRRHLKTAAGRLSALPEEDRAILAQLARGRSNEAIAAELGLSGPAVELRRARLLVDLELDNVSDLLRIAYAAGMGNGGALRDNT